MFVVARDELERLIRSLRRWAGMCFAKDLSIATLPLLRQLALKVLRIRILSDGRSRRPQPCLQEGKQKNGNMRHTSLVSQRIGRYLLMGISIESSEKDANTPASAQ